MTSSADICNRALNLAGCEITIGDLQEGTREAQIALRHYTQTVWALLRAQDHEFSRTQTFLVPTLSSPPPGWDFEYVYPVDCLKVRSLMPFPAAAPLPLPVRWDVGTRLVNGQLATLIWTNLSNAWLIYTTNGVSEDQWDGLFTETVVQYLSSSLAPLLTPKDAKGQSGKEGPEGYAQAARVMELDVSKDS